MTSIPGNQGRSRLHLLSPLTRRRRPSSASSRGCGAERAGEKLRNAGIVWDPEHGAGAMYVKRHPFRSASTSRPVASSGSSNH